MVCTHFEILYFVDLLSRGVSDVGFHHYCWDTLIEEDMQCPSFFLVLKLTNNNKQICCTALTIRKEFFTTPFLIPTSQCGFAAGRRRGVVTTESRRAGLMCSCSCRTHLIFKTSTEEQTVDLTNKDMTRDSQRFSRWFHRFSRWFH
jgi:hypothetical protein